VEVAYTLQVGREAMEERLAFVVSSIKQLTRKLQAYVTGTRDIESTHRGQVTRGKERLALLRQDPDVAETLIGKYIAAGKPAKLLDLWVNGLDVGWHRLYGEVKPRRIALPLYPFSKERCWIDAADSRHAVARSAGPPTLHPLLHANTSDFSVQSYRSVFSGEESFLADHRVRASGGTPQRVLPGVAYLEMARAALERAMPDRAAAAVLELRDTVWLQPLVVTTPTEVSITLSPDEADELAVDAIVYEIHSHAGAQRTTHCQGRAVFGTPPAAERIDVLTLQAQMTHASLDSAGLYALFARMGLEYGPAHRGIEALYQGGDRVLASLRLPAAVARSRQEYWLHPSLLDSALQAAIGLSLDPQRLPSRPPLPFSLESVRILSACEEHMFAWVRRSPGPRPADAPAVDIDLCDRQGRICVQIRAFTSRILEPRQAPSAFDTDAYRKLIEKVSSREISIEAAVEFG
jgi:acyl transferase domain-containing protein